MKIAVLIPGHLRTWYFCKQNFMETIYDSNYDIDIFVDTYNKQYRANRELIETNSKQVVVDQELLDSYFKDLNIVYSNVTDDDEKDVSLFETKDWLPLLFQYHTNKLLNVTNTFIQYEQSHQPYDIVIKTRFDVLLEDKLDYQMYYDRCKDNDNNVFVGDGIHVSGSNDIFAIGNSTAMKKYGLRSNATKRIELYDDEVSIRNFNVDYSHKIPVCLARLADNNKVSIQSFLPTRHVSL